MQKFYAGRTRSRQGIVGYGSTVATVRPRSLLLGGKKSDIKNKQKIVDDYDYGTFGHLDTWTLGH